MNEISEREYEWEVNYPEKEKKIEEKPSDPIPETKLNTFIAIEAVKADEEAGQYIIKTNNVNGLKTWDYITIGECRGMVSMIQMRFKGGISVIVDPEESFKPRRKINKGEIIHYEQRGKRV